MPNLSQGIFRCFSYNLSHFLSVNVRKRTKKIYKEFILLINRWKAKNIEHYEKFRNLWRDADPGIAEVEDV